MARDTEHPRVRRYMSTCLVLLANVFLFFPEPSHCLQQGAPIPQMVVKSNANVLNYYPCIVIKVSLVFSILVYHDITWVQFAFLIDRSILFQANCMQTIFLSPKRAYMFIPGVLPLTMCLFLVSIKGKRVSSLYARIKVLHVTSALIASWHGMVWYISCLITC